MRIRILKLNLDPKFHINPIMLDFFTQVILFAVGYVVSLVWPKATKKDVEGLTVWSMRQVDSPGERVHGCPTEKS